MAPKVAKVMRDPVDAGWPRWRSGHGRVDRGRARLAPAAVALALRLKFVFSPLLAVFALGWLGCDWTHGRGLDAAETSIFAP